MYKLFQIACLCCYVAALAATTNAQESCSCTDNQCSTYQECCPSPWRITAETLILQRASSGPIAESRATVGDAIDQAFAGDRFQPGLRLSAQHVDACGNSWELAYFGFHY